MQPLDGIKIPGERDSPRNLSPREPAEKSGASPQKRRRNLGKATKLAEYNLKRAEITRFAPDLELCSSVEDSVESHHYFFNLFDKQRPRKFKDFCSSAKEDKQIQQLISKRKSYQNELLSYSYGSMNESLLEMMIKYAKEGKSFKDLPLPQSIEMPELEEAYNALVSDLINLKYLETFEFPTSLDEFCKLSDLKEDEVRTKLGYTGNRADKLSKEYWNSDKKQYVIDLLKKYWNEEMPLAGKGKTRCIRTIMKEYFEKGEQPNATGSIFLPIRKIITSQLGIDNKDPRMDIVNKLLNPILMILFDKLNAQIALKTKGPEDYGEKFKEACKSLTISNYLDVISGAYHKDSLEKSNGLKALVKEQKQHSITRFYNLINYYTAFTNTIHNLCVLSKERFGTDEQKIHQVINRIVEQAPTEMKEITITEADKLDPILLKEKLALQAEWEAKKNMSPIDYEQHRDHHIMGYEIKNSLDREAIEQNITMMNLFANTWKAPIDNMQRSHTLPFPTCFAWKRDRVADFVKDVFGYDKEMKGDETFFNKSVFETLSNKRIEHTEIEALFQKEFSELAKNSVDEAEFLYKSLELVRKFYLRLFSETELLPDFVNKKFDGIAEWKFAKKTETDMDASKEILEEFEPTYKHQLTKSVQKLMKLNRYVKKTDTVECLKPYFKATAGEVVKAHKEFIPNRKNPNFTTASLLNMVCLYQIEEGMRIALHGSRIQQSAIDEIFKQKLQVDSLSDSAELSGERFSKEESSPIEEADAEAFEMFA